MTIIQVNTTTNLRTERDCHFIYFNGRSRRVSDVMADKIISLASKKLSEKKEDNGKKKTVRRKYSISPDGLFTVKRLIND